MKTKLLFFLPNLNGGGAEKVAVNMLRQLNTGQYEFHLVLTEKKGQYLDLIPSNVIIHDLKIKKTILAIFKLRKIILEIKPDIVFSTLFRTHIAMDLALIGLKNKPKVIYRSPNSPKLLLENNQLSIVMKYFLERAYSNANTIIAQTPEMKNEITKFHSIDSNKIRVFLNPIDKDLINKSIKNIDNPFDSNFINVVAAGRLLEQKGFDFLIQSFKLVISENSKFRLYIIGEDIVNEKINLEKLIKSLELEDYVSFLGFQNNPYKYFYYSDLYVLSSRWEGLPNTVLENLYLKKPVIATKCIVFMDTLIKNGENGLLVDVEDEISLGKAILKYKIIDTEYQTINFDSKELNELFQIEG